MSTNRSTIVTMFFNIRPQDTTTNLSMPYKTTDFYFELANTFILRLPHPLIIFMDELDKKTEEFVVHVRQSCGMINKTHIFKLAIQDTYFYKDIERIKFLMESFVITNSNQDKDTALYVVTTNNKMDFMERAIELNPFQSSHFLWMDFGINHVAKDVELIDTWFPHIPDKIKQLCINPYLEDTPPKEYFQLIYHNCAGGLFSGSVENLLKYSSLFKQKTADIYQQGWYQLDEAVMTIVQRENPDLFDLFYGDYEGIISNYTTPKHSWWLISTGMRKCLSHNNTRFLFQILKYLEPYFSLSLNRLKPEFYEYLNNCFICEYYQNNQQLRSNTIQFINEAIERKDPNIQLLLTHNLNNLNYYTNKHLINYEQ